MWRRSLWLLSAVSTLCSSVLANDIDYNAKAAYFVDKDRKYVVGVNMVKETGDIWVHMSGPSSAQYFGVGIGASMTNSFMLVSYATANGSGVTTSPRYSTGQTEPTHLKDAVLEKIWSDSYGPNSNLRNPKSIAISHTVCRNCSRFAKIDWTSASQPFFWAIGPKKYLGSDEMDAALRLHAVHGTFTMNMTAATNYTGTYGRVPAPNHNTDKAIIDGGTFTTANTTLIKTTATDIDSAPIAHGACMLVAFVLVFPLGAVGMRVLRSVLWHIVSQVVGVILVIAGLGLGVKSSQEYKYTQDYKSAHQTLGMLLMALLLLQVGTGLTHHLIFKSQQKSSKANSSAFASSTDSPRRMFPINKFHMLLGVVMIILAIVNGGLGFQLADNSSMYGPYGGVVAIVILVLIGLRLFVGVYRAPRQYEPEEPDAMDMYVHDPNFNPAYNPSFGNSYTGQFPAAHFGWNEGAGGVHSAPAPYERNGLPYSPRAPPAYPQWYSNYPASPTVESPHSANDTYYGAFRDLKTEESREQLIPIPERPEKAAKTSKGSGVRVTTRALD